MGDGRLDRNTAGFREAGHRLIERIADYLEQVEQLPVLSTVAPGQVASQFSDAAPEEGVPYSELFADFETKVLPGVTHWNHPAFFAYFAITGSQAGILGELLSAALNINGMLWRTSPAATELETKTLGWLRDALGLPGDLFGIINDTASINTFLALAAAREATGLDIRARGMLGRDIPRMRVYWSEHAHSSADKAALALGIGAVAIRKIAADEHFRMRFDELEEAVRADRTEGILPIAVVATAGTTSTAAFDPIDAIANLCEREKMWLHVDAAYGGPAALLPELRPLFAGIERADSVVVNPHKWLFTPVDCSVLYTRRPDVLQETFTLVPEYLKTSEREVIDYMNYGLQLGRRFRALKLWMVIEHYGLSRIRSVIRQHIAYAARLEAELRERRDVEIVSPASLSVVVFRKIVRGDDGRADERASEEATVQLLARINSSGEAFVSHTRLNGKYAIRVAIGNGATEWHHVERLLRFV